MGNIFDMGKGIHTRRLLQWVTTQRVTKSTPAGRNSADRNPVGLSVKGLAVLSRTPDDYWLTKVLLCIHAFRAKGHLSGSGHGEVRLVSSAGSFASRERRICMADADAGLVGDW